MLKPPGGRGNSRAPHTEHLEPFELDKICLDQVKVEEFCGFVYINLDPFSESLSLHTDNLENGRLISISSHSDTD
ncbi:MAG: hypothetical protein ACI8VW_001737 [bacterium]|jgi:hypothetical protein